MKLEKGSRDLRSFNLLLFITYCYSIFYMIKLVCDNKSVVTKGRKFVL